LGSRFLRIGIPVRKGNHQYESCWDRVEGVV
jgi:hypothetical protein